jgi:hypothetical protein
MGAPDTHIICHVHLLCFHRQAVGLESRGSQLSLSRVPCAEHDMQAALGKLTTNLQSDPAIATGDKCHTRHSVNPRR